VCGGRETRTDTEQSVERRRCSYTATAGEVEHCVAGLDDGFFERSWSRALMVLAVHCWRGGELCPCRILLDTVEVDGIDATEAAERLARRARAERLHLEALLTDTVVFAGFNILDPAELQHRLGLPVVVIYWYPPRREAVERALRLHFPDWRKRLAILEDVWARLRRVECSRGSLLVAPYGVSYSYAWGLVCRLQLFTRHPEPLFTAHRAASMLSRALGPL